jgi:8-oxo-dGTP pyrophosphatase MutT (NUDIX family)
MSYRTGKFWQPDVTVATVVVDNGRLLMVEERVAGLDVFNQPAGHLEPDESIMDAAIRETLEETGWQVELSAFIGAYQWTAPETGQHYLRMAFAALPVQHFPSRELDHRAKPSPS